MSDKNNLNNGDIYGARNSGRAPERNDSFGKVAPDKEPAYYEETQLFQRPVSQQRPAPEKPLHKSYHQNGQSQYAQGGYPQNGQNQYAQGGYPQNGQSQYAQGGYPQNGQNQYAQGGYPQNGQNQYAQGGYPHNDPDPYRKGSGNPYLNDRRETLHNEPVNDKKRPAKKKKGMKASTAVLIVVTLAVVLFGLVPAAIIFLFKDKDESSSKSSAAVTTSASTEESTEDDTEAENTTEEETEETEQETKMEFVDMPDVVGLDYRTAEMKLKEAGLRAYCKNEYSSDVDKNEVISQDVKPGVKTSRGKLITLKVSLGPEPTKATQGEQREIPDVKGMKLDKAIEKLEAEGFTYSVVYVLYEETDGNDAVDTVASQSPSYGIKREKGAKVKLTVYKYADKTPVATGKVVTEETELNVRKENNTNSDVLGKLSKGSNVDIIYELDGWYAILYNGEVAYVSKDYVELPENVNKIPQMYRSPKLIS